MSQPHIPANTKFGVAVNNSTESNNWYVPICTYADSYEDADAERKRLKKANSTRPELRYRVVRITTTHVFMEP